MSETKTQRNLFDKKIIDLKQVEEVVNNVTFDNSTFVAELMIAKNSKVAEALLFELDMQLNLFNVEEKEYSK